MPGNLRFFLLREALRQDHAKHFIRYSEQYHSEVFADLKKTMYEDWSRQLSAIAKRYPPREELIKSSKLRDDSSPISYEVTDVIEKIATTRHPQPISVSPSFKIPFVVDQDERSAIIKELMEIAATNFEAMAKGWREIFHYEHKGRLTPNFRVLSENHEVRFQLAIEEGGHNSYRTLYAVRVEYGKKGGKKAFDRVYLVSLI